MPFSQSLIRAISCAAVLANLICGYPVHAQPAASDICVLGEDIPGIGRRYYQHNEIIMANYDDLMRSYEHAEMRDAPGAGRMQRRLRMALEDTPGLDRRLLAVVMEPPTYSDYARSCDRQQTPPRAGEYPIVFKTVSPRLIGDMCAQEPEIRFDISPARPVAIDVGIEMQDFYDPELTAEKLLSYADLERRADRRDKLAALIRGLMGIRMTQCSDLPASMTLTAVRERESIMTASLLFLDDGIQILTRDDATGRRLAEAQMERREQLRARSADADNWEERAAAGAAIVITGLAIMLMNRCNDNGVFGNTALPDCE